MRRRATHLVLWGGGLVALTAMLHALGTGALSSPPLDPARWLSWAQDRDPFVVVAAVLRLGALALSWYLLGATCIGVLGRLARAARLVRVSDALTVPALRRLLQATLGASLATMMVTTAAAPGASAHAAPAALIGPGVVDAAPSEVAPTGGSVRHIHPGLRGADDGGPEVADGPVLGDARVWDFMVGDGDRAHDGALTPDASAPDEPDSATPPRTPPASTYEVVSGESLWTIAHAQVAARLDREPTDGEVARYWRELIATNRDRLADPDNPDLIFPGQPLAVPPVGKVE